MRLMRSKTLCTLVLLIATPQFSLAAAPKAEKKRSPLLTDIALQKGGVLVGRLTDKEGNLRDKQKIILRLDQEVVAEVTTGKNGQFQVKGLQGGIYEVASEHGAGSFRAWADDTAPPSAKQFVVLIENDDVVRGQFGLAPDPSQFPRLRLSPAQWVGIGVGVAGLTVGTIALVQDNDAS
ncbi:MAG: hypothetical protein VX431_00525 [Planctomycetota bacterium]|nr:hypothetical protein [Planctomycetota bacterium]